MACWHMLPWCIQGKQLYCTYTIYLMDGLALGHSRTLRSEKCSPSLTTKKLMSRSIHPNSAISLSLCEQSERKWKEFVMTIDDHHDRTPIRLRNQIQVHIDWQWILFHFKHFWMSMLSNASFRADKTEWVDGEITIGWKAPECIYPEGVESLVHWALMQWRYLFFCDSMYLHKLT